VCQKTISSPLRRTLILAVNLLIESLDAAHKDRLTGRVLLPVGAAVEPDDVDEDLQEEELR